MEKTVKDKLWNLTVTMTAENVGGGEDRYQEWLNIRKEIQKLCTSLESVASHEKWMRIVTEIKKIRQRVEDLKVANWLWSVIKKELDGCVEMINEHERGDFASDRQPTPGADVRHPTPGAVVSHDVDMLDRDQVEQDAHLTKKKEEYTKQIGPLKRQYMKMVRSMESALDKLRVTRQPINENYDDVPAVQMQIQGYIDDCKRNIEIAQAYLSHAMMTDEKIIEIVRSKIKKMYQVIPYSKFDTRTSSKKEKNSLFLRNIEACMLIFWFESGNNGYTHWNWCKITDENALETIKNRVLPLLKEAAAVEKPWDINKKAGDILTEIISDIETWLYDPETRKHQQIQKVSEPSNNLDGQKLRVKLYIIGDKFWDLSPITPHQRIGLVLSHVVPFSNWNGLHCSIDRGNDEGIWRDIYMDSRERYSGKTEPQIMKDVMEKLDTVQTEAFGTLRDDPTTIMSLNLGVKGVFKMPKDIQPWTGVGSVMPDSVDSLLTSLKTYV